MIIRENVIEVEGYDEIDILKSNGEKCKPEELIFFDLEHYVYKKPKCIGVFGACIYNNIDKKLYVTQYMIENKSEVVDILVLAKKYFLKMKEQGKKYIVTFSGNNDFTVINYLVKKYNISLNLEEEFDSIDIQKEYEKSKRTSIGLKNLEKIFEIYREGEVISGSNLAKTFHKVLKDDEYIKRMPKEKIDSILLYNEQDVVNLFKILILWEKYMVTAKKEENSTVENLEESKENNTIDEDEKTK